MSKKGGWVPLDKKLLQTLPRDRPYSTLEAMFSYTVDLNCGREGSISGYSRLWGWSRNKVRRFLQDIHRDEGYTEGQSKDRKGTGAGHPIHFIDGDLWASKDREGTGTGQMEDTTNNPNPNPKVKEKREKKKRFVPPTVDQVAEYCRERGNSVDPRKFVDFYEAKDWMVGKNRMKDWKAAVRTWEGKERRQKGSNRQDRHSGFAEVDYSQGIKKDGGF